MRFGIDFGLDRIEVTLDENRVLELRRAPPAPALADPAAAVRSALDAPVRYPPLWRGLTPDDHVTLVLDERLPRLGALVAAVLEHVSRASVAPAAITLLCPPTTSNQLWLEELPEEFEDVHVEVHDPTNRQRLSYLATTRHGRRLYLNRTAVDADQLVVLGRRGYDPVLGYAGFAGDIYPALSDEATRSELGSQPSLAAPDGASWPVREEANEVAWLLGAPFFLQIIEGAGDSIAHVITGSHDSSREGQQLLDARWRGTVAQPAETVVATVAGDPHRHDFPELARAVACAARVVQPGGRIVLLSQAAPQFGPGVALLRQAENPTLALTQLRDSAAADLAAAFQWASAAQRAKLYVLSGMGEEATEELFAVPLEQAGQVQRLLNTATGPCLVIPDANKALVLARNEE